jgi:hypothetical protein
VRPCENSTTGNGDVDPEGRKNSTRSVRDDAPGYTPVAAGVGRERST